MQIIVSGQQIDVTPALRTYVEEKFARLERHFDHLTSIHVVLSVQRELRKAEATIQVSGGSVFADAEHEDMYAAIDELKDKLDRQVKKFKEKLTDHHRGEGGLKNLGEG